jgi:hypothetical protein
MRLAHGFFRLEHIQKSNLAQAAFARQLWQKPERLKQLAFSKL